jgi:hypothetical protein
MFKTAQSQLRASSSWDKPNSFFIGVHGQEVFGAATPPRALQGGLDPSKTNFD